MLIKYSEWLQKQMESSPATRTRREIALGLKPVAGMGSLHGHSTAAPWEVEKIEKKIKKKTHKRK